MGVEHRVAWFRLANLPVAAKVMLSAFLALVGLGYLIAVGNIYEHHAEADLEPGISMNDLRRVYHGIEKEVTAEVHTRLPSPMLLMVRPGGKMRKHLERGGEPAIRSLMGWLETGAKESAFAQAGSPEPGDPPPQQVIANQCIRCHNPEGVMDDVPYAPSDADEPEYALVARKATGPVGPTTQQTQVISLAPTGRAELVQITHAHILAIPVFTLIVGGLFLSTGLRPVFKAALGCLPMLALCFDFASWWLARLYEPFVYVVAGSGGVFGAAFGLQILCVFGSMWFGRTTLHAAKEGAVGAVA